MKEEESRYQEKRVPLHVKANDKGPVFLIPKEDVMTLAQKQKEGAVCTLSSMPPAVFSTDISILSNSSGTTSAQHIKQPSSTIKLLPDTLTSIPAVHPPTMNQLLLISTPHPPNVSLNSTDTSQSLTFNTLTNVMSWNPEIPSGTQISTVDMASAVTTATNVMNHNCRTVESSGTRTSSVMNANSGMKIKTVGLTYKVVGTPLPLNTSRTQNFHVLPQSSSMCLPKYNVNAIPITDTIPRASVPKKFVVGPSTVVSTPSIMSGNGPRSNIPDEPQFLIAKINKALSNQLLEKVKISSSPSRGGMRRINIYNQTLKKNIKAYISDNIEKSSKIPVIIPKQNLRSPALTQEVITPKVQSNGKVVFQRKLIPWTKDTNEEHRKANQFTLSEVSNNPSESGVARKCLAVPVTSVSLSQNTVMPTTSKTVKVPITAVTQQSYQVNTKKHCQLSPPSLLPTEPTGDIDPRTPVECGPSSDNSTFQWHQPCISEATSAAEEPEAAGDAETKNGPFIISDDDDDDDDKPVIIASSPPPIVAGVAESNNDPASIADDDYQKPVLVTSAPYPLVPGVSEPKNEPDYISNNQRDLKAPSPPLENSEEHAVASTNISVRSDARIPRCIARIVPDSKTKYLLMKLKKKKKKKITEIKRKKKMKIKEASAVPVSSTLVKPLSAMSRSPIATITATEGQQVCDMTDVVVSQTNGSQLVSSSSRPSSPPGDTDPLCGTGSLGGSSFQWHHPSTDIIPVNATDELMVAENSEFKTEVNLSDSDGEQARVLPSLSYEPNPENIEYIPESKYAPRSDTEEMCIDNEPYLPKIEWVNIHSVATSKCETFSSPSSVNNQNFFSCDSKEEFSSIAVENGKTSNSCVVENASVSTGTPRLNFQQKECDGVILNKMQVNLKKRLKAKADGLNIPSVSMPLKRMLMGGQDKQPNKIQKKTHGSASSTLSNQHDGQKGNAFRSRTVLKKRTDSSRDIIVKPNVLRDCIVRKTIQDCYSDGVIPTIDLIYNACCDSGLDFPKTSVEPHLNSIGYNWVECHSQRLLVEDHKFATERIKYLKKLKKYQGKNLVYIFVSEYVKKNENCWQMSPNDMVGPCLDSARIVLHAMNNRGLLEGGFEVLKLGLFRLRRNDIIAWLKCNVMPNIPEGSVIILGHHPIFDKNDESEERPSIEYSKDRIVSWLMSHKVPSVNPDLPKALLLSKVDKVILPKTSIFDELVRQNGFVPLHLPKHHMDLNPVEYLWQDIVDKLYKTPEVESVSDFQDFVTQEFSCSQMAASVACNLVRNFECTYREFDLRFDELFEKLTSITGPCTDVAPVTTNATQVNDVTQVTGVTQVTDVTPVADVAPKNTTLSGKTSKPICPVCLCSRKLKGYRCSNCKDFWYKLRNDYKFGRYTGAKLPFCNTLSHISSRPASCQGCRRYRYERVLFHHVITLEKAPKYIISIPPVTEMGIKHWSKETSRCSNKLPNLAGEDSGEEEN